MMIWDCLRHSSAKPERRESGSQTEVVVELQLDGNVAQADRWDAVRPPNAKRSDVKKILNAASAHFDQLVGLGGKS